MSAYVVSTPADELPFDAAAARTHCKAGDDTEDAELEQWIRDAVAAWETYTGVLLMPQQVDRYLDCFPAEIRLSKTPIRTLTSITYVDAAGATQTLVAGDDYQADLYSRQARIQPAYGKTWPITRAQLNAVRVRLQCGFSDADLIPADIIGALRLYVDHRCENRSDVITGTIATQLPNAYQVVANRHRVSWF